jgi:hypothetical protein
MRIPNIARRVSPWAVNRADGLSQLPGPQAEGDKSPIRPYRKTLSRKMSPRSANRFPSGSW